MRGEHIHMSKKKVAKLGLTAAIAATTFVAANPADAASVSQAEQAVKKAEQNAKGLVKFYSSEDLKVSAEFTASYNNVRKLISDAKAQLVNYKGKDKSQLEAILASAENHQAAAARYIDAVGILNGKLVESTKAVSAYIKSQELNADTVAAYDTLSAEIKKAEAVIGKVRGAQIRKAFKDSFLLDAKLTREALIYEVSQYQLLNQINEKLKAENVDLKEVQADFAKLDRLKERAVDIKKAGKELYPDRDDVYPTHTAIEQQLRKSETDAKEAYVAKLAPAVESVSAINGTKLEIKFTKAIDNTNAIEEAGNRVVVYSSVNDQTKPNFTSKSITFSADKKTATVIIANNAAVESSTELVAGQKYTVALVDNNNTPALAKVVLASESTELVKGLEVPTADQGAKQDKFVVKFNKKMAAAAATVGNYKVYDSSNLEVASALSSAKFVDTISKDSVELTVAPGTLKAGHTYTVKADNTAVLADDSTKLTDAQSKFTINTPSIADAKPKVNSIQVTSGTTITVTFDKDLKANGSVDLDFITVKKSDGTPIALTSGAISGKTLTITATNANSFEDGKTYKLDVASNVALNDVYRNATSDAISTTVTGAENKAVSSMTAQLVRQSDDKEKFDLVVTFDQPVKAFTAAAGDIKINALGKEYAIKAVNVEAYSKDSTGKSLIIKDAGNAAVFADAASAAFPVSNTKSYEVVAEIGKIATNTPHGTPKTNTDKLKATVSGIDVTAPKVDKVTLASSEKIVVKFDETIKANSLSAGDVKVKGYTLGLDGSASAVKDLSGANQIKVAVSGDTVTITPANSAVKFVTGTSVLSSGNLVEIAQETIKDVNDIVNASAYQVTYNSTDIKDEAAPVILSAATTSTTGLDVTYSENVSFKATGSGTTADAEAAQFSVNGVKTRGYAVAGAFSNNVLTLTFGANTFEANKDYSTATLDYTKNVNYRVEDATGNQAASAILTGLQSH
ncbi:Ig-like domain-containing protein [Metabacillus fastidiosus]|uniref:Ig-like domain-containing protein n=1 Tax=Metabacillus fastidiosus TaxID=1458 RepID=UPI003D2E53D8